MALDIVLTVNGEAPEWTAETSISLEDLKADYAYLCHTLIENLKNKTGQLLDPYDNAQFSGKNLHILNELIREELEDVQRLTQNERQIHVGTQLSPTKKELYDTLHKNDLVAKLTKFLKMTDLAIANNEKIVCMGD